MSSAPLPVQTKCLTVDALWAWAIMQGLKRVENRNWFVHYRGRLAIHAGKSRFRDAATREFLEAQGAKPPTDEELDNLRGKILGTVDLVDMVPPESLSDDPYATGPFCWVLRDPKPLRTPLAASGSQGLWHVKLPR